MCGAIFRAAGREKLAAACRAIGHCATGSAVITPAFGITTARTSFMRSGPSMRHMTTTKREHLLRSAYRSAIELAAAHGCKSMAFPAISTGIYGYPLEEACAEAADVCREMAASAGIAIKLVAFDRHDRGLPAPGHCCER